MEVQHAFNTTEGLRDKRQHDIVRIILQNGKATATAWEKKHTGQVIYSPIHRSCVCAARADCHVSPQELTTREAKTVAEGKAAGAATATAWDNAYQGKVICAPPPRIIRVCATRADCHVSPQELTTCEAKTVAEGKERAEAWSNLWDGKVQAYQNM